MAEMSAAAPTVRVTVLNQSSIRYLLFHVLAAGQILLRTPGPGHTFYDLGVPTLGMVPLAETPPVPPTLAGAVALVLGVGLTLAWLAALYR